MPVSIMKTFSSKLLEEITKRLVEGLNPDQIILFGSHAWGTATEDSDLDLMIIVPETDLDPHTRAVRALRCLRGLNFSKDVLVKTQSEVASDSLVYASLVSEILEKGRVLYVRGQVPSGKRLVNQG